VFLFGEFFCNQKTKDQTKMIPQTLFIEVCIIIISIGALHHHWYEQDPAVKRIREIIASRQEYINRIAVGESIVTHDSWNNTQFQGLATPFVFQVAMQPSQELKTSIQRTIDAIQETLRQIRNRTMRSNLHQMIGEDQMPMPMPSKRYAVQPSNSTIADFRKSCYYNNQCSGVLIQANGTKTQFTILRNPPLFHLKLLFLCTPSRNSDLILDSFIYDQPAPNHNQTRRRLLVTHGFPSYYYRPKFNSSLAKLTTRRTL
jgi:hypothetical protein